MSARRLLVIDDEQDFCSFVREVAEGLGYEVTTTASPEDFKQSYETNTPSRIIVDMIMPEVDGIELVQWLTGQGCSAQVLVITGFNPNYAAMAAILGEAKGLEVKSLTKPIRASQLRAALE